MMGRTGMAAAVLLFGLFFSLQAQNRDATKAADQLFSVINAEDLYNQQVKAAIDEQIKKKPQFKSMRAQIEDAVNKEMPWKSVKKDLEKIYAKKLNAEDLNSIAAFYKTPAGAKLLSKVSDKNVSWKKIQENPTVLTEMFSPEELAEIVKFMQTPSGMKLVQKAPELTAETEAYLKKRAKNAMESAAKKMIAAAVSQNVR